MMQRKPGSGRYVVTGTRHRLDGLGWIVSNVLDNLGVVSLAQGGADGVDACTRAWAREHEIDCKTYPALWEHGPQAGPERNRWMLEDFKPDAVIAFPLRGPRSVRKGTTDCIEAAIEQDIRVHIFPVPWRSDDFDTEGDAERVVGVLRGLEKP